MIMKNIKSIKRAFSIVELLVATLVIAVLVIIAFTTANSYIKNMRTTQAVATIKSSYLSSDISGKKVDGKTTADIRVLGNTIGFSNDFSVKNLQDNSIPATALAANAQYIVVFTNPQQGTWSGAFAGGRIDAGSSDTYFSAGTNLGAENIDKISQFSRYIVFGAAASATPAGTTYIWTGVIAGSAVNTYIYKISE